MLCRANVTRAYVLWAGKAIALSGCAVLESQCCEGQCCEVLTVLGEENQACFYSAEWSASLNEWHA